MEEKKIKQIKLKQTLTHILKLKSDSCCILSGEKTLLTRVTCK